MSDRAQQSILQKLERLLPHIRRLEVENKATADEKAATTEAAIGEQLAKVIARDAALQRETEQQRAARERVAAVEAAPIIEAIRAAPAIEPIATEEQEEASVLDRLAALTNLHKATLVAAGFPNPDATLIATAQSLGSKTNDVKYARIVITKHLEERRAESLAAANLAAALPEPDIALDPSSSESQGQAEPSEEFSTPKSAQRTRAEGSGVAKRRQQRGRASPLDPLGLLERIHGEILAGNRPLAAETVRLWTNAVRTLVRRGELSADEGQMIGGRNCEMSAAATPAWWSFRELEEHADEDTDHPLAPRAAGGGWGWLLNLVAGDLPRALRQHSDPKKAARWIRPDRVVLISPNASEPKYDLLADALDYGDPEASFERYSPDDEELPTEFDASGRNLLILEDLYNAPKAFRDRVMTPAFTRLRHQGVSTIMTTQSYFDTDKGLRRNATHLALHPCGDDRALSEIVKQFAPKDAHGEVVRAVKAAHDDGGFAVFDSTAAHDSPRRFHLRWDRSLLTGQPLPLN